jgi:predicted nuclease of predicted toxin-antitoxin system
MVTNKRLSPSFYFDEDVSVIVAKIIRAHGFKVTCASEVKECGRSDKEQLEYAAKNSHILITHNIRDFIKPHRDSLKKERVSS